MKKKNRPFKAVAFIIAVAVLFTTGIFYYLHSVQNSLWNQAVLEILEVTSQGSHAFEVYIEKDMQILSRIAKQLSMSEAKEDTINDIITLFEDSEVGFTVIDLDHGLMYAENAEKTREIDRNELEKYEAFAEREVREPYLDEYTGRKVFGGYQRFAFLDGTDGIVQVKRKVSIVEDEFMLSFYNNKGFSYIANKYGDILIRSSNKNSNSTFSNLFDVIELSGNSKESVKKFSDSIEQEKEGVMRFTFDGEENIFAFSPLKGSDGWYIVTIIPDAVVMKHADEVLKSSQTFFIIFAGILLVAGLILYMGQQFYKKIEEKEGDVQYRERLFSILANNTNDVFLMFTTDNYSVEYVSPNIERLLGVTQNEIKASIRVLDQTSVNTKEEKTAYYHFIKELENGASMMREVERVHHQNGERRWFLETIYRILVNDSERYVAVLSDRTNEQKSKQMLSEALEIAKAANESKSVFLSNMSHDIRTPMNAIVGFSTLLQRDAHIPEKVYEYTRKISSSSQHLLGLINDVLDMSKIESGKTTLNLSEISLAELIDELGSMMQIQAKAKKQKFKIVVYDICNEEILGDRLRINQILINILSNAVKYTPEGGRIEMTVRQLPQYTKNYVRFQFVIKDNGIGMSKEYLETIFQPFSRESNKKTLGIQGTGLGMAITKNLVDLMGGTIEVESEQEKGSTFTLGLELRIKEQDVDQEFWEKHGVTNLLVVDDEEEICLGIQKTMADTGVNIQYALGGQAAVSMAESFQKNGRGFDLVLIDWQMPDLSGIETARRIRKIVPSNVPIMILTAYDISRIEEEGAKAGVDGFLQKPFFLSNFKMIIDNLKKCDEEEHEIDVQEGQEEQDDIFAGLKILAAEDIELNAEILMELLNMAEAECVCAENGKEVLEKFEQSADGQYDLILMDVQMPVMNGYEATRAIRRCSHPQAGTIPIIAMTANTFSEDVKDALDAGMNAHVGKPIDMEHLKTVIKEVMR